MKTYFDEATDKRLLEAQTEEEVKAIIAETPEAEKLADKTNLVMAEIARIKGAVDNELDSAAGGDKVKRVDLSPSQSCIATFFAEDMYKCRYCWSNDQCAVANEYEYHHTRYSNCKLGGGHDWRIYNGDNNFFICQKCDIVLGVKQDNFDS